MTPFDATRRPAGYTDSTRPVALLALAAILHAASASAQSAAPVPFLCQDGAMATYAVPAGVTHLYVVAAGGGGANTAPGKAGAAGATVSATVPVEAGQTLGIVAGCAGRPAPDIYGGPGGGGYGRGGDGGSNAFEFATGAGGGGASALLDAEAAPLLVAGGGGGTGGTALTKRGGRGGKGTRKGTNGANGAQGGAGGRAGASSLADGADGFRSATAGSGGGGGGGYGGTKASANGPIFLGGGGGGETAAEDVVGGGGGGAGGPSFAAPAVGKARYGGGRGPLGNGFAFLAPHKPWKPTPTVAAFSCKNGKTASFRVPPGVAELTVVVSGATGGTPFNGLPGEGGARVTGTVPVTAGQKLSVVAGCPGLSTSAGGKGFVNGAAGIGAGLSGGGGGSSALLNGTTPLIAAGGGNGGGAAGGPGGGGGGSAASCAAAVACGPVETGVNHAGGTVLIMAVPNAAVTVPDPPTEVTATAGIGQATVSFTAPVDSGNSAITGYTVTATNDGKSANGTGSPIVVTGLTEGGLYAFTVTATNAKGASVPSEASNPVNIPLPPWPPTEVTAEAGNGQATVSFEPPEDDGDSSILSYTATAQPGGQTATGPASPLTVTGLSNGSTYTIRVHATNAVGSGPAAESNAVVPQ